MYSYKEIVIFNFIYIYISKNPGKKCHGFHKNIKQMPVFNIDDNNKICFLSTKSA